MNKVWVFNTKEEMNALDCVHDTIKHLQKETGQKLNSYEQEIVFVEVMKFKGIKPAGQNELTKAEFIKELVSKGKKILNVDQNGFTFIKKRRSKDGATIINFYGYQHVGRWFGGKCFKQNEPI